MCHPSECHEAAWDHHFHRCWVPHLAIIQTESVPSKHFARVVKAGTNYLLQDLPVSLETEASKKPQHEGSGKQKA